MPVGSHHAINGGVPELFGNNDERCSGLDELACVGVPQPVEAEFVRKTSQPDCVLEQVAMGGVDPRTGAPMKKDELILLAPFAKPDEERHALIGQINVPGVIPLATPDVDTKDRRAHIPHP